MMLKAPKFEMEMGGGIHPDWTVVVSNQLTLITQTATMLDKNQQMKSQSDKEAPAPAYAETLVIPDISLDGST